MAMSVLVAYASERGSTQEIAEHVAARLSASGFACTVRSLDRDTRPEHFDAVVLGSAVHGAALLPAAVSFVNANEHALSSRPLWLFSVGLQPSSGHHQRLFARLIAGSLPREVPEIRSRLGAIDYHAFAGVLRASETRPGQRVLFRLLGGQFGDFRDWPAIDRWADGIAARLTTGTLTGGGHG